MRKERQEFQNQIEFSRACIEFLLEKLADNLGEDMMHITATEVAHALRISNHLRDAVAYLQGCDRADVRL